MRHGPLAPLGAVALLIALAACGGGGGSGAASAPAPAPVAPVPVSDLPFPGSLAPLWFGSAAVGAAASASSVAEGATQRFTGLQSPTVAAPVTYEFVYRLGYLAPSSWGIDLDGWGGPQFNPVDLVAPTSGRFDSWRIAGPDHVDNLDIAKPGATGLDLRYTGIALYASRWLSQAASFTFLAPGLNVTDVRGPLQWQGIADGFWFDGSTTRRLFGSPAAVTLDQNGDSTLTMTLRGHADAFGAFESAPTAPLGTFTGAGRSKKVNSRVIRADGTMAPADGYSGLYGGTVYGPNAEEIGVAFALTGPGEARAWGVVVGRR